MEQWTGSKSGKEYKGVYHFPVYLTYTQSTSCEMPGLMNHKLESRLPGETSTVNNLRYAVDTTLMAESEEALKSYDKPREHIKKQRHHFADKVPYSQSFGFSSSHV